jgi:hypothetical protein
VVGLVLALGTAGPSAASPSSAQVQPYGKNNLGSFRNVLPPGEGSLDNGPALAAYEANHNHRPAHWSDQLQMYSSLTTAAPHIRPSQIGRFYKSATFGVRPGQVARTEQPEPGVTIEWDKRFGVPHIYGATGVRVR